MRMRIPRRVPRPERPPRPAHHRRRTGVRIALAMALAAVPAVVVLGTGQAAEPAGLDDPVKKEIAMRIVSTAENSSLEWREQFDYIEDIQDGRGYTAGIIGFCSGTHDMLELVEYYTDQVPGNPLAKYLPALRAVDGSDSHEGLDPGFTAAWEAAATTEEFRAAQEHERDRVYFGPSVSRAKSDGLRTLGQFVYYDAIVMHGRSGFDSIRDTDAECPSLSPDGTRIAFKKRVRKGTQDPWRLHVLDLRTMRETPLAETRSVDDQAAWLDGSTLAYALPGRTEGASDVWTVPADGSRTPPRLVLRDASSPSMVPGPTGPG